MKKNVSPLGDVVAFRKHITAKLPRVDPSIDPFACFDEKVLEIPRFEFFVQAKKSGDRIKRRLIGNPNEGMRKLHKNFGEYVARHVEKARMPDLVRLPSATAFSPGSSPLRNAMRHLIGRHFYLVDLVHAYDMLNTDILAMMLVAIVREDEYFLDWQSFTHNLKYGVRNEEHLYRTLGDPLAPRMQAFINTFIRASHGRGLITGAPVSPYLFNLYGEVMLDAPLRHLCRSQEERVQYMRYADDLTFSSQRFIWSNVRREIRKRIETAGFDVNHRKSQVLYRKTGPAFVTGFGIGEEDRLIYPGKKRRRLKGMLLSAIRRGQGDPQVLNGHIAAFEEYLRLAMATGGATASDRKMIRLITELRVRNEPVPY